MPTPFQQPQVDFLALMCQCRTWASSPLGVFITGSLREPVSDFIVTGFNKPMLNEFIVYNAKEAIRETLVLKEDACLFSAFQAPWIETEISEREWLNQYGVASRNIVKVFEPPKGSVTWPGVVKRTGNPLALAGGRVWNTKQRHG